MACVLCDNYLLAGPCPWCEATKGDLRAENDRLRGRVAALEALVGQLSHRLAACSEALGRVAEVRHDPGDLWRELGGEGG